MYRPNLQSVALAVPEIIVIAVLGWVVNPQSWGRGGRRGSGTAPFERALVTSYRLFIVTFPLSLRVSEILPLLFSSTPPHLQISPCSRCTRSLMLGSPSAWALSYLAVILTFRNIPTCVKIIPDGEVCLLLKEGVVCGALRIDENNMTTPTTTRICAFFFTGLVVCDLV